MLERDGSEKPVIFDGFCHADREIACLKIQHIEPKWKFPKMGVPPNHPNFIGISQVNHAAMGYPHDLGNPNMNQPGGFDLSIDIKPRPSRHAASG